MQAQVTDVGQLLEAHHARLYGFMRARVRDDTLAHDLTQDTCAEVWSRAGTFDPDKGTFWALMRAWAEIVLRRHWTREKRDPVSRALREPLPVNESGEWFDPLDRIADESASTEERLPVSAALTELLRYAAGCSRPPHEIVVFGFSRLEWKPRLIVERLADVTLTDLVARLEHEYERLAPLRTVHAALLPLRTKLAAPVRDVMPDPRTRRNYPTILDRIAGDTRLRDYFPEHPPAAEIVTRWWDSVKRATCTDIRKAGRGPLFERLLERMMRHGSGPGEENPS